MNDQRCPNCGGSNVYEISPGYWQCRSYITQEWVDQEADFNLPLGPPNAFAMRSVRRQSSRPCGQEFQTHPPHAPLMQVCRCGLFAVGVCSECKSPTCGRHGQAAANFVCAWCIEDEMAKRPPVDVAKVIAENEQRRKEDERRRIEALPEMGYRELVRYARGELQENESHRIRPATGRELVAIVRDAGIVPRAYWTGRRSVLRKNVLEQGYVVRREMTTEDPDRPHSETVEEYLNLDGSHIRIRVHLSYGANSASIEHLADPSAMHDSRVLRDMARLTP